MTYLLRYAATRSSPSSAWHLATSLLQPLMWPRRQSRSEHLLLSEASWTSTFALQGCTTTRRQVHDQPRNSVTGTPSSKDGSAADNHMEVAAATYEAATVHGSHPQVPVVPGVLFQIAAGDSAVKVEHVAGWSDAATIQGRPSMGEAWMAVPVAVGVDAGADVAPSRGSPQVRQTYDVFASCDTPFGDAATTGGTDNEAGCLRLAVPEKWVSLDISTTGRPVSVSKVVEADLRVATQGAPVTLGSVRGLQVHLDTTVSATPAASAAAGTATTAPQASADRSTGVNSSSTGVNSSSSSGGDGGDGGGCGSVQGGEVSGTAVTIVADGNIVLRRLIGGTVFLEATAAAAAGGEGSAATCSMALSTLGESTVASQGPSSCKPLVALGAVYGGKLQIHTGGGAVRVGTLDCGFHVGGGVPAAGVGSEIGSGAVNGDDCGDPKGCSDQVRSYGNFEGGARILSYGGSVTLDSLEGDALVDSGGGPIKVLVQGGIRTCKLLSGGGTVDLALSYSTALAELEIRGAGLLRVDPELESSLKDVAGNETGGNSGGSAAPTRFTAGGVWRAALAPGPDDGRAGGRGLASESGHGRLSVDACGGAVSVRRLGWMDALRAKIAQQQPVAQ